MPEGEEGGRFRAVTEQPASLPGDESGRMCVGMGTPTVRQEQGKTQGAHSTCITNLLTRMKRTFLG